MNDNFLPDYMRDALRSFVETGDPTAVAAVEGRLTADLLGQLVTPDADTPKALLDTMARTMAAASAIGEETARWNDRQGELLEALRDTPRVVVEYVDFLHRSMVGMQTTVADSLLAMAAGFDEAEAEVDAGVDALLAAIGLTPKASAEPEPPAKPEWQVGDLFLLDHPGAVEQVVIATLGPVVFHANGLAPGAYVNNSVSALDRYATRTGRLGAIAMGDVRRRFADTMGCTIEERLGLAEP